MPELELESPALLKYLRLPENYEPSPSKEPLQFLKLHISVLPQYLLQSFSKPLTPRQRTSIPLIKNRRTNYVLQRHPQELKWDRGRVLEPLLWENMNAGRVATASAPPRPGVEAGVQEREWAERHFVGYHSAPSRSGSDGERNAQKGYVGRLGELLAEYEEEREAERLRMLRRERIAASASERETEEEFDTDSSDDEITRDPLSAVLEAESTEEVQSSFERVLRERFIDGFLPVS
jgi:hypothetical protein